MTLIEQLLDDPTVEIELRCGTVSYEGRDGFMQSDPTHGRTLTITVQGGAVDIQV